MTSLKPSDSRRKSLQQAAKMYHQNLPEALSYLSARGITEQAARWAGLGVVQEPAPGHEGLQGRLSIPYITPNGVVDIKFRCMRHVDCKTEGCVKYLAIPGLTGSRLYNVRAFFDDTPVIAITEGEFDALVLTTRCEIPAVGCAGVQRWEPHFPRCFAGYDRILVFTDGDQPGRDLGKRICNDLAQATMISMPTGQDVNSVFLAEGSEGIRKRGGLDV